MKSNTSLRSDGLKPLSSARLWLCGAAGILLAGCASEPASVLVSAPPPPPPAATPVYTTAPVAAAPGAPANSYVVVQAPPAQVQQEVPTARPSTNHVWVPGSWTWRNSQYQWLAGRWEVPPRVGAVWIPARWEQEGSSFRFYEGHWE